MKIIFISDLHIDINIEETTFDLVDSYIQYFKNEKADIVIISGDISNDATLTLYYINTFIQAVPDSSFYFVPGNHDITSQEDSNKKITLLQSHSSCIHNKAIHLNEQTVLIGWMGWYDYTFRQDYHYTKQIIKEKNKNWYDGYAIQLHEEDTTYFEKQIKELDFLLNQYPDKNIILSTHFVPFKQFLTHKNFDKSWNRTNSFLGSKRTGELILKHTNIIAVSFGHIHYRFGLLQSDSLPDIICSPLGYSSEWSKPTLNTQINLNNEIISSSIIYNI